MPQVNQETLTYMHTYRRRHPSFSYPGPFRLLAVTKGIKKTNYTVC